MQIVLICVSARYDEGRNLGDIVKVAALERVKPVRPSE
jgi:hypothetical protein